MNSARQHVQAAPRCQPEEGHWVDSMLDSLLPRQCLLCPAKPEHYGLCAPCLGALPRLQNGCRLCALPLHDADATHCGACLQTHPAQDRSWAAFHYRDGLRELLRALKFHARLAHAKYLGQLLVEHCPASLLTPDTIIVPAPLHLSRLRQRGFNQARELIRPLAREWALECDHQLLIRHQHTQEQSTLKAAQRWHNVRSAFLCREKLSGERIVVFDDVMTTGATMQAMTQTLKQAGAGHVTAISLARA